jgi:tRNA(Ile)-lysidine synthase
MLNKLCAFVRQNQLLEPGDRVVCAVSGGADSMALLFAMYLLKEKLDIQLSAAHFNHCLRGAESDEDEAFVRDFCHRFDIPLACHRCAVQPGEKGLEAAARDARYGFLQSLPGKIATAHTANDNAETVLMHLLRGTGLKGLGAISPSRGNLIRPMLSVTRGEVLSFLEEYHIPHQEDSSNGTDQFLRNRLRHHVMPLLEAENPALAENLSAMALRLRQDEAALAAFSAYSEPLEVEWLKQQPGAIRMRVLEHYLKVQGVKEPEARHLAQAEALAFSDNPSAAAAFPGGVTLRREYGILTAEKAEESFEPLLLPCPGTVEISGYRITCRPARQLCRKYDSFTVTANGPVVVRPRHSGDTMRLAGGSKSLKKLFVDRKIPAAKRSSVPVIADALGVLGVCGIGANLDRQAQSLPAVEICITQVTADFC